MISYDIHFLNELLLGVFFGQAVSSSAKFGDEKPRSLDRSKVPDPLAMRQLKAP